MKRILELFGDVLSSLFRMFSRKNSLYYNEKQDLIVRLQKLATQNTRVELLEFLNAMCYDPGPPPPQEVPCARCGKTVMSRYDKLRKDEDDIYQFSMYGYEMEKYMLCRDCMDQALRNDEFELLKPLEVALDHVDDYAFLYSFVHIRRGTDMPFRKIMVDDNCMLSALKYLKCKSHGSLPECYDEDAMDKLAFVLGREQVEEDYLFEDGRWRKRLSDSSEKSVF